MKRFCLSLFVLLKNSHKIIYLAVFVACVGISISQFLECLKKLQQPPISTHYLYRINETLNYPAVTICRNPPYKSGVLQYYKIGLQESGVEHTSEWKNFPFESATLQQLWDNATYRQDEVVKLYGLHGESANAEIRQNYYFFFGRCFTFIPRVGSKQPWPNSGWSILLQHIDKSDTNNKPRKLGLAAKNEVNGFHVFIHEAREPWTENISQTKYLMNYLYVEVEEEIDLKINTDEFHGVSSKKRPCSSDINYSQYQCIEQRWWTNISQEAGCTAPWMRGVHGLPHCNKYEPLLKLLNSYTNLTDMEDSGCPLAPCTVFVHKAQIVRRQVLRPPFTQLFIYYTGKGVAVMQEQPGYDAAAFLADLGGSLGFFLGLSVVGALGVLEKICKVVGGLAKKKEEKKEDKKAKEAEQEKA